MGVIATGLLMGLIAVGIVVVYSCLPSRIKEKILKIIDGE